MASRFTLADYDRLPEGFPAQLIGGQLVKEESPTYGHQSVQMRITLLLVPLVPEDRTLVAPIGVRIDRYNAFHPDVVVLRELPARDSHDAGVPLLVVEVLSPSTRRRDRKVKCHRLLEKGVEEVWLVDEAEGTVERFDVTGGVIARGEERIVSNAVPGFELVPARLFRRPPS